MFDRSKYKKTTVESVDETIDKAQSTMNNPLSQRQERASFYSVAKEGRHVIRILPAPGDCRAYVPRKTAKLPIECPVYDSDGKDTGKKEIKMKDVFTADVHSERMGGKDAVITYLNYVYAMANDIQDADERKKFLAPINGYRDKKKNWVWGVAPTLNYVAYVFVNGEFYRLDIRPAWWKKMKSISLERASDDSIKIDVFSDPEEGYALIINSSKDDKDKWQFDLSCALPKTGQSWEDFFAENAVTDEMFEIMEQYPTLEDQYKDIFSRKDWNLQLEGLERLDEKYGYGIFQNDEFLNELEELEKLVPEDDDVKQAATINTRKQTVKSDSEQKSTVESKSSKPSVTSKSTDLQNKYPSLVQMKRELKAYIKSEYEDTETLPEDLTLSDLKHWYDLMKEGRMLPFDDDNEEESESQSDPIDSEPDDSENKSFEEDDEPVKAPSKPTSSIAQRLAELRDRKRK